MAYLAYIDHRGDDGLTFANKENALQVVSAILADNEQEDKYGSYAVMLSREEQLWRVDFRYTDESDPVVFENAYYVDKHYEEDPEDDEVPTEVYSQGNFDD